MVTVERPLDVEAFLAAAGAFLVAREAEHNLILGICWSLRSGHASPATGPIDYLVARAGESVVACAIRTPPHRMVLSEIDDPAAVDALADAGLELGLDLPGVEGPSESVIGFVRRWTEAAGRTAQLSLSERIFRLTTVRPPSSPPPGRLRLAEADDRDRVVDWFQAFAAEALPPEAPPLDAGLVDRRIALGAVYVWDDRDPVSVAGVGGRTPHGARVGPVYTPPPLRGRGYASALVAGASEAMLGTGLEFLFLYTDLANPTANHIYETIGYEPVRDVDAWRFERPR